MKNDLAIFEGHQIRRHYDEATETWWFSVVDIVRVLTQSDYQAARKYWKVLKGRLAKEGSQLVTNCYQLKMTAEDGKQRLTNAGGEGQ
jgi:DNA-damage-inducible protein D